jgi:hypothetical protein
VVPTKFDLQLCVCLQTFLSPAIRDTPCIKHGKADTVRSVPRKAETVCAKADTVNEPEAGQLSICEDGSAVITMPLQQSGSGRSRDLEGITRCIELLWKQEARFMPVIELSTAAPKCTFRIRKNLLEEIPLLLDIRNITCEDTSPDTIKQTDPLEDLPKKLQRESRENVAPAFMYTVPFKPPQPASASGLACLLLLLNDAASPLQLFGASLCGPRLATEALRCGSSCTVQVLCSVAMPRHLMLVCLDQGHVVYIVAYSHVSCILLQRIST